ncbi:MAG: hypothetical protein WEA29_07785 [Acidimicrobiia bacterium]
MSIPWRSLSSSRMPLAAAALTLLSLALVSTHDAQASDTAAIDYYIESQPRVEVGAEPLCGVSDDSHLLAGATETEAGHFSHEDWIANERAQEDVNRVHGILANLPRSKSLDGNTTPEEETLASRLSQGVVGVTHDNVTQQFIIVVDATVIDMEGLKTDLAVLESELDIDIQIRPGCHSIDDLARAETVLRGRAWHADASKATYGFYVDPATATFNVTLSPENRALGDALGETLGELVTIEYGEPSRRGRLNDGEPHYGGAGIGTLNNNFCTSGFTIVKSGARGSVTAGHCYSNGTSVYSGPQYYGYSTGKASFPTYDMIRIASSVETYANKIHVDPCCPSVRTVVSDADTQVDNYVCVSGMVTRAVCGLRVVSMSGELCDALGCTPNLGIAEDPAGRTVGQGGDSGAPIYTRWSNNRAQIHGMEIGGTAPTNVYFHKISRMESILGMSVAHS